MLNNKEVLIIEKPDYISWNEIKTCIWNAHSENRSKGIFMRNPSLPSEEIRKQIMKNDGIMLVALIDGKVVGTAAITIKRVSLWCGKKNDNYAHFCFASVLPQYNGMGIFKLLDKKREQMVLEMGLTKIIWDTHEQNYKRLKIAQKNNYKFVDYKVCKNHFNIVLVKWLHGCPYSNLKCALMFTCLKFYKSIRYKWLREI